MRVSTVVLGGEGGREEEVYDEIMDVIFKLTAREEQMTRRILLALCCTAFLSAPAFAGDESKTPPCCANKAAKETTEKAGKLRCALTGKEMEKCCCTKLEGGRLHCTLANKDIDTCCCTEVKDKAEGKEAR